MLKTTEIAVEILKTINDDWHDSSRWACELELSSTINGVERKTGAFFSDTGKLSTINSSDNLANLLTDAVKNSDRHDYFTKAVKDAFESWRETIKVVAVSYDADKYL